MNVLIVFLLVLCLCAVGINMYWTTKLREELKDLSDSTNPTVRKLG